MGFISFVKDLWNVGKPIVKGALRLVGALDSDIETERKAIERSKTIENKQEIAKGAIEDKEASKSEYNDKIQAELRCMQEKQNEVLNLTRKVMDKHRNEEITKSEMIQLKNRLEDRLNSIGGEIDKLLTEQQITNRKFNEQIQKQEIILQKLEDERQQLMSRQDLMIRIQLTQPAVEKVKSLVAFMEAIIRTLEMYKDEPEELVGKIKAAQIDYCRKLMEVKACIMESGNKTVRLVWKKGAHLNLEMMKFIIKTTNSSTRPLKVAEKEFAKDWEEMKASYRNHRLATSPLPALMPNYHGNSPAIFQKSAGRGHFSNHLSAFGYTDDNDDDFDDDF